ncbi:MAG TPA: AfsR/SARP family transcriptional regulator [Streptosporangiaceae bacterium]
MGNAPATTCNQALRDGNSDEIDDADFRLLGPVEAGIGGRRAPVDGGRQLAVLAALALSAGRVVTTERLTRAVWDDTPPPTARAQIHGSVHRLRRCLPGLIRTEDQGYLLAVAAEQVDAGMFRCLVGQARAAARDSRPAEAAALYRSALGLWRGDALSGVAGLREEATELEEERSAAIEGLFAAELGAGRHAQVVADLYGYVRKLPWRESLRGLLMLALYRCGREAEALTAYWDGHHPLPELGPQAGRGLGCLARAIQIRDPRLSAPSARAPLH